jgi:autotransporter translocation and assembly factor TamB
MRRLVKWSVLSLTVLLLLVGGFASWLLFTTSGARWVTGTVTSRFAPKIRYARIDGTLAGEITITDFQLEGGRLDTHPNPADAYRPT